VASWHFDEGSGTMAYDSSGNDDDGTITGATWVDGKFGKALSFDGVDDDMKAPYIPAHNLQTLTIEFWMKTDAYPSFAGSAYSDIIIEIGGARRVLIGTYASSDNYIQFSISFSSSGWIAIRAYDIPQNEWIHVIASYDGEKMKLLINNEEKASYNIAESINNNTEDLIISNYYEGLLDEVRVYNEALSTEEISDLYNNYGYTTENYPGKVLVRKYTEPEPSVSISEEETA